MKRLEATGENLAAELKRWQKILRVMDWEVTAEFAHQAEIPSAECAIVQISGHHKSATIKIVWPSEFPDYWAVGDWQNGLVHELIHLHMERFMPAKDDPAHMDAEAAISLIASALLELDRQCEEPGIIETTEKQPAANGTVMATYPPIKDAVHLTE